MPSEQYKNWVGAYGTRAMVSVKGWHQEPKRHRNLKSALQTVDRACKSLFGDPQASDAAKGFFGSDDFKKVLVISRLDKTFKDEQKKHAREVYKVEI